MCLGLIALGGMAPNTWVNQADSTLFSFNVIVALRISLSAGMDSCPTKQRSIKSAVVPAWTALPFRTSA